MIYKFGNILDCPQHVIAHGVNAMGVYNKGLAKQIRERYPEAYRTYLESFKSGDLVLGYIQTVKIYETRYIVNMVTQQYFGNDGLRYVDYDAIQECFEKLFKWCQFNYFNEVAIPKIGAGLGGGNWEIIESIIDEVTPTNIKVFVYELQTKKG